MNTKRKPLTTYVIKNLMLEALSTEDVKLDPQGHIFKTYGYSGSQYNLFRLTEALAINKGLLIENIKLPRIAWGVSGGNLFENSNTNFKRKEIESLFEAFALLLNQNIISPGVYGEATILPAFHVTDHGHACLKERATLPYDSDGYLGQVQSISNIDQWVQHYLTEALRCFNAGCYQASTIMVGLAAEKIVLDLLEAFKIYLKKHDSNLQSNQKFKIKYNFSVELEKDVNKKWQISYKYAQFEEYFKGIQLDSTITGIIDESARNTFYQYLRLLRNEVSHPTDVLKDETETMLLFVSFIKYVKLQTDLINALKIL
ncbi:hypothetical protein [Neobacillus sp. PS3-40]|uniref:hypothetical protein n=1 Tax=Neobacillus sp. PS3-40 TaxID=3070679 RepID=UPI0027DF2DEE|nr:hypothetical protein [Neobacillus sp. PS3-40]WML42634.1 hypothetical protein RCG20_12265 [Neobacillus sp. PS3-40]